MTIYRDVLSAVVRCLAAECIDNTAKQAWQKLYSAHADEGAGIEVLGRLGGAEVIDNNLVDCLVFTVLHKKLKERHWHALAAKYSTHKARKVEAIGKLLPLIATPAPKLFLYKAVTAWAVPKLKGARVQLAPTVSVDIPVDASPSKQAAIIKAALAADQVRRKRIESRSADMIVLPDSFYDMSTWDPDAHSERTRREWRQKIHAVLDEMVSEALKEAEAILHEEGLLLSEAA
ncbi:hypothetical protein [Azotobacter salinestris]|uniref:hypothetical protein n=1 Tax=Azotobacter salinestris TaxID=69964 RepID=UPI0032E003A5